jgi:hypothetical protein
MEINQEENYRGTTPFIISPRYQTIFLVSCYHFNNFGNKAINCKDYSKNKSNYEGDPRINHLRKPHEAYNIKYNSFGSLNDEVECYKCNNFGHVAKDCRLTVPPKEPKTEFNNHKKGPSRIWIRK